MSSCSCATGSHPPLLNMPVRSERFFLSMIHSHTNDPTKNFSLQTVLNYVLCKKENENTQMLSNSSVHLEAIKGIMPILEESQ